MGTLKTRTILASSAGTGAPVNFSELPPIEAPDPKPPMPECDHALGTYMRAYNEIEKGALFIFEALLDANPTAAHIIFNSSASAATLREIISALGRNRLSSKDFGKLQKLLEREKKQGTIRNRLVHGTWAMSIKVHRHDNGTEVKRTNTWVRWYQPTDPELIKKMSGPNRDRKLLADYEFFVPRIRQLAEAAHGLGKELQAFADTMTVKPYQSAQPSALR